MRAARNLRVPHLGSRPTAAPLQAPDTASGSMSALQKSFSLLECLIGADHPLALSELASELALPKATVHRLLLNMQAAGLLSRDGSGKCYVLGDRLTRFSLRALAFSARSSPVQAVLEKLVAEIGESVNLGILDGISVAYAQRVECNWPLRTHLGSGSRVPLHCTATGKLFLALMPKARQAAILEEIDLHAYTPNTITSRKRLMSELAEIREQRLSVNHEEFMVGAIGLSVPLVGVDGEMVAGLALHAPVARMSADGARKHVQALRRAADKLARALL